MNTTPKPDDSSELVRLCMSRMTPARRRVALVLYDEKFARWQCLHDPLFKALVSLYSELTSPYITVASPKSIPEIEAAK